MEKSKIGPILLETEFVVPASEFNTVIQRAVCYLALEFIRGIKRKDCEWYYIIFIGFEGVKKLGEEIDIYTTREKNQLLEFFEYRYWGGHFRLHTFFKERTPSMLGAKRTIGGETFVEVTAGTFGDINDEKIAEIKEADYLMAGAFTAPAPNDHVVMTVQLREEKK